MILNGTQRGYYACLIGIILLSGVSSFAQKINLSFSHITPKEELTQLTNAFIYCDSRGYVWISSTEGVFRYDGLHIKCFKPDSLTQRGLKEGLIQSKFFEDKEGNLWFATLNGIHCYIRKSNNFETVKINDEEGKPLLSSFHIFDLEKDSVLWMTADQKLYKYNIYSQKIKFIKSALGVRFGTQKSANREVKYIIECPWVLGFGLGLIDFSNQQESPVFNRIDSFRINNKLQKSKISQAIFDNDTLAWLCSDLGLLEFNQKNPDATRCFPIPDTLPNIRNAANFNQNLLFGSSSAGLWMFDKKREKFVQNWKNDKNNPQSLSQNRIQELYVDPNKILWVSIYGQGVDYAPIHSNSFVNPIKSIIKLSSQIKAIVEDKKGNIWCNTAYQGISIFNKNGKWVRNYDITGSNTKSNLSGEIQYLYSDNNGDIWVISGSTLFYFNSIIEQFVSVGSIPESPQYSITQYSRHSYYLSTYNQIYEIIKKEDQGKITLNAVIHSNSYLKILPLSTEGTVHVLMNDSLKLFYFKEDSLLLRKEIAFPFFVYSACKTNKNNESLLSTNKGILLFDAQKMKYFHISIGKNENRSNYYGAVVDKKNRIWAVADENIWMIDSSKLKSFIFQPEDGFEAGVFQSEACLLASDGKIWFGGSNGLAVFHPDSILPYPYPPYPHITAFSVNNIPLQQETYFDEAGGIEFSYNENNFALEFTAAGYYLQHLNKIRYRLLNYDGNWQIAENGATIRYNQLPPKKYTLELIAINANGVESVTKILQLVIHPPFWQRWWFIVLVILTFSALGYTLYRYRISQIRKEYRLQQQTQDSEMKALRAQMKPHFFFNSLNSINATVLRNENEKASDALTLLADLMRQILDNSSEETITLETELRFLNDYLHVEFLRLGNKLNWTIQVAPDIDKEETEIPSMIIQPFIENAVWHGISPKPEGGKVSIDIHKEPQALVCTIEDNGIGREAAAKIRQKRIGKHESKGEKITLERLSLYDQKNGTSSAHEVIDLTDGNGKPLGTRIILKIGL